MIVSTRTFTLVGLDTKVKALGCPTGCVYQEEGGREDIGTCFGQGNLEFECHNSTTTTTTTHGQEVVPMTTSTETTTITAYGQEVVPMTTTTETTTLTAYGQEFVPMTTTTT